MSAALTQLLAIMHALRDPAHGCPWDIKQDFKSITVHTLEEVYEVVDAIDRADMAGLEDELGDLLFQIIFYAEIAQEKELFDFESIIHHLNQKLIRRHPHVFIDNHLCDDIEAQWDTIKAQEKSSPPISQFALHLPAMQRAQKLQKKAHKLSALNESNLSTIEHIKSQLDALNEPSADKAALYGDLLFALIAQIQRDDLNAEQLLRQKNNTFAAALERDADK